jgi:hypothetical protein
MLAQVLGSMSHVEYIEEPWTIMSLPMMQKFGLIDTFVAQDMMRAATEELFIDRILLRNANFRAGDLSSIWKLKDPKEIMNRLINLNSRGDVQAYVTQNDPILLYVLAETNPFINFLLSTFSQCRIIHVVRNGLDVALEIASKMWFNSDQLRKPVNNILYRKSIINSEQYFLPWWVAKEKEENFVLSTEFAKGLFYWKSLMEMTFNEVTGSEYSINDRYQVIRFEDILSDPKKVVDGISSSLGITCSDQTRSLIGAIRTDELGKIRNYPLGEIYPDDLLKVNEMLNKLGYKI